MATKSICTIPAIPPKSSGLEWKTFSHWVRKAFKTNNSKNALVVTLPAWLFRSESSAAIIASIRVARKVDNRARLFLGYMAQLSRYVEATIGGICRENQKFWFSRQKPCIHPSQRTTDAADVLSSFFEVHWQSNQTRSPQKPKYKVLWTRRERIFQNCKIYQPVWHSLNPVSELSLFFLLFFSLIDGVRS